MPILRKKLRWKKRYDGELAMKIDINVNISLLLIGLILIILKCFGIIDWSWWIVFVPFFMFIVLTLLIFLIIVWINKRWWK